ncbi:MAG: hypothetical protein EAX96_02935 [Candidatus Lokiarchaeota archaeon]|nr:hypothetical protein [Candidatus Lokiarchaeota archaeon]
MEKVLEKVLEKFITKFVRATQVSEVIIIDAANRILYNSFTRYEGSHFELQNYITNLIKKDQEFCKSMKKKQQIEDIILNYKSEELRVHITDNKTILILHNLDKDVDLKTMTDELLDLSQKIDGIVLSQEVFLGKEIIDLDSDIEKLEEYEKVLMPPTLDIKKLFKFIR